MKEIALITGASSGIGREFARQLAPRCSRLILVGRRAERLEALAAELGRADTEVLCLAEDLGSALGVAAVVEIIRQRGPVSLLVNNAGFATDGLFAGSDIDLEQAMVNLHCNTSLALSRAALPYMLEMQRGQIINVASIAAFRPFKGAAVYGASKAFLLSLSQSLAKELAGSGVAVQCLCPGYTRSEFHSREPLAGFDSSALPESLWSSVEEVVSESLAAMDSAAPPVVLVPGEPNVGIARRGVSALLDSLPEA